ncbi:CAP-Gly domain-containing linker protein 1-like [Pyrus ussuriensis x Pyrus communis]|uniref:FRIGIDA-like protein n=1 Tax=Pyrus ussuriensis x Pyrus communis TaxID=2448454 RepID=A0A5N5GM68_9ROSA|nr:CAP-Gly domain-containing linker protein 1-like [Pyrus ussuriensis x Pyrus communis]
MENIESDLKESELKQSTLRKAYDCLHAHATSLAVFSVQWKDLEDQFESTRLSIEAQLRELEHREEQVRAKAEQLEIKKSKVSSVMESKSNSLQVLQKLVDEKKNHLLSLQSLIREHSNAVIVQEKRLEEVEGFVREKERECDLIKRRVEQRTKKLNSVERSVEDMALKERELRKVLGSMEARKAEFDLREGALKSEKMAIQECDKELKVKAEKLCLEEQDICLRRKSMEEWSCKLELKEKEIDLKEKQVKESREEGEKHLDTLSRGLQTKENKLRYQDREIELKQKELISIKKSTEEHNQNLKLEERRLENQAKELELKQKELDLIKKSTEERTQYLKSKERQLEDQAKELELKQNKFYSIRKSTEEYNQKLKSKERQLEGQIKELELKQKEFDWIRKENTENLKLKERQLEEQSKELELKHQKIEMIEKSIEEQALNLKLKEGQLEEQANGLGLKQKEFDSITKSTEEHIENLKSKENTGVLCCQVKIEQLEHLSVNNAIVPSSASNRSSIDRDVRGLQLNDHLKRYDLVGSDISAIFHASSDPAKFVLDALQGFYTSKSTMDNSESDCDLTVIRRSCIHLLENLNSISPHISPHVREAIKLAGEWKPRAAKGAENCLEVLGFMRLVTAYEITSAYDTKELQSLIPDMIQGLIEKKLFIEAVRWICMFKLTDMFPPVPLLEKFVENTKRFCRKVGKGKKSLDEKDKVINDQIADLRAVIECIKDCDLEAMYPFRCIESRIASLESKESQIEDKARDLKSKQKEFILIKKSLEEQARKLKSKERQLEFQAKELELKRKEFDSSKKSTEEHIQNLQSKENYSIPHSQVKMQQLDCIPANNVVVPSFASNQPSINWDGRGHKRSTPTYDPGFQPQQQRANKYPRTSESAVPPYPVQNFNPGFPQPRPPLYWQHHGQFGMATNYCEIGAYSGTGFGAIPTPGVHYSQPYRPTPLWNSGPFEPV